MLSKRSVVTNLKKSLEVFLKDNISAFSKLYDNIEFSRIAFCYDPKHYSFSFSINTQFDQNKAVLIFSARDTDFVKTNPKHWRYQNVGIIDIIEEEHFKEYFSENTVEFYDILRSELKKFINSHAFKTLKRSKKFVASFVIEEPFVSENL